MAARAPGGESRRGTAQQNGTRARFGHSQLPREACEAREVPFRLSLAFFSWRPPKAIVVEK